MKASPSKTATQSAILSIVEIAALFHDVGKASALFQSKILAAARGAKSERDAIRHELMSALQFAFLVPVECEGVHDMARCLATALGDASAFQDAWDKAAKRCAELHSKKQEDIEIFPKGLLGSLSSVRAQTIFLILGHHRLPGGDHLNDQIYAKYHVDRSLNLADGSLEVAPGTPFWETEWFGQRLKTASKRLLDMEDVPLHGLDVLGRTPLMMSDHIGSFKKEEDVSDEHLANTLNKDGGRGDSLLKHVTRVVQGVRPMTFGTLRGNDDFPSIAPARIPEAISSPSLGGNRFDWQPCAAHEAERVVSASAGGFFSVLTSGTGTGKTRGAAILMAAASIHDRDQGRRNLRFNLALPLRTLTRQSGVEYIEDLGFAPDDVATLVGGYQAQWLADTQADTEEIDTGSEDRLTELEHIEIHSEDALSVDGSLSALSCEVDRRLPAFADQLCDAAGDQKNKARDFLSTPIIAATIDHLMPSASPLRGQHLIQTLRTMSADLIVDELDLLSEEDLSAVKRLVRIVGMAGRRVLLMSATMPRDIVASLFDVYRDAYSIHAQVRGNSDNVNFLCASDVEGSVASSFTHPDFGSAFDHCEQRTHHALGLAESIHVARIMDQARDWDDQVEKVSQACDDLHRDNHFEHDGLRVSAGLVRMTRVKHLQALAEDLGDLPSKELRVFAVLHSRMPRAQREYIEKYLKSSLTRKGKKPNECLLGLLTEKGIISRARQGGHQDIQFIVLASPVIETGNDVDFDWLIADPCSVRSLVQAAGRVNRHRRAPVQVPNIIILGDYCVVRASGKGRMEKPGPETRQTEETGVKAIEIDIDRSSISLLGRAGDFPIDARLTVPANTPLAEVEARLRVAFDQESAKDFQVASFWWSRGVGTKHRFRRSDHIQIHLFPVPRRDRRIDWVFWPDRKSSRLEEANVSMRRETHFRGVNLFSESLHEILQQLANHCCDRANKASSLSIEIRDASEVQTRLYLDPVLGLLGKNENIDKPVFSSL